jgi:integrase
MANFLKKAQKGTVVVQSNEGRLRLQLPIHLFDGKQKFLDLNMADTVENRELAQAKAQIIEADIKFEEFDSTLKKYKPPTYLTVVESIKPKTEITFSELF